MNLIPCKVCGSTPELYEHYRTAHKSTEYVIICPTCGRHTMIHYTRENAERYWNKMPKRYRKEVVRS